MEDYYFLSFSTTRVLRIAAGSGRREVAPPFGPSYIMHDVLICCNCYCINAMCTTRARSCLRTTVVSLLISTCLCSTVPLGRCRLTDSSEHVEETAIYTRGSPGAMDAFPASWLIESLFLIEIQVDIIAWVAVQCLPTISSRLNYICISAEAAILDYTTHDSVASQWPVVVTQKWAMLSCVFLLLR